MDVMEQNSFCWGFPRLKKGLCLIKNFGSVKVFGKFWIRLNLKIRTLFKN